MDLYDRSTLRLILLLLKLSISTNEMDLLFNEVEAEIDNNEFLASIGIRFGE